MMDIRKKIVTSVVIGFSVMTILIIIGSYVSFGTDGPRIIMDFILNTSLNEKKSTYVEIDESGIPLVNYGYIGGKYIGTQRNPVTVSQKIFEYYNDFKDTGNSTSKQYLINNANWLLNNADVKGNHAILYYDFPWPVYDLPSPWRSAMAQGQALQALIKSYEITNDTKYIDTAKLLLNSFFVEIKDGGVTYKSSNDGWWYEEYAHEEGKISRVLNGMMYTTLGIYDYYNHTKDPEAKLLFENGVLALKHNISIYNFDGNSYYDVLGKHAGKRYHEVHIKLSNDLYEITNEEVFKKYHDIWNAHRFWP